MKPVSRQDVLFVLAVLLLLPRPAHAYVDASLVSVVIQGVVAVVAGGLVMLKLYWQRVKQLVGRVFKKQPKD